MINNKMIEVKQDLDSLSYDTGIEIKIISENFDSTEKFAKLTSSQFDTIMMADSSLNRENILVAFLYINSYIGCRPRQNDGSEYENAKDNPEAFFRSIKNMAEELSMSKDTINQCIEYLTKSFDSVPALLIKREVGSVQPDKSKPPQNVGHQRVRAAKELGIEAIMVDIHEYKDDEDIFLNMLLSNLERVKEILSIIKRCKIVSEIEKIYKKREQEIKKERDIVVNNYRNEIAKNKENIIDYYNGQCAICKFNLIPLLEVHHILPLQQGGDNSLDNITCLCPNCHTIIHKFISHFSNGIDINNIAQWLEDNYSKSSYDKLICMYEKYIKRKEIYGWEELTWI